MRLLRSRLGWGLLHYLDGRFDLGGLLSVKSLLGQTCRLLELFQLRVFVRVLLLALLFFRLFFLLDGLNDFVHHVARLLAEH